MNLLSRLLGRAGLLKVSSPRVVSIYKDLLGSSHGGPTFAHTSRPISLLHIFCKSIKTLVFSKAFSKSQSRPHPRDGIFITVLLLSFGFSTILMHCLFGGMLLSWKVSQIPIVIISHSVMSDPWPLHGSTLSIALFFTASFISTMVIPGSSLI